MPIHPETRVGHIHLKVTNLERAVAFYSSTLGFEVTMWYGDQAVFLSAGGYHHHIGLNTWHSEDAGPAPIRAAGLYHVAFVFPNRESLATTLKSVLDSGVTLTGAADHGVSEAVYFNDPDGNGIELYVDRDPADWPRATDGSLSIVNNSLDVDALLEDAR